MGAGGGKRVFDNFQDLSAYLKGQLGDELAKVEEEQLKPLGSQRAQSTRGMREALERAGGLIAGKKFKEADDEAWRLLRQAGLSRKEDIVGPSPEQLAHSTEASQRPFISSALTIIGTSLRNHGRHLDSVHFLERAVALDGSNVYAMRNLSDMCIQADRGLERDMPYFAQEIDREVSIGLEVNVRLLKMLGVEDAGIQGRRRLDVAELADKRHNILWILNNQAALYYKRGRHLSHNVGDAEGAKGLLRNAVLHAQTTLEVLGLPRDAGEVRSAAKARKDGLGPDGITASRALTFIGSSKRMLGEPDAAYIAYAAALEITPDLKEASDNLQRLVSEHPGLTKRPAAAPAKAERPAATGWGQMREQALASGLGQRTAGILDFSALTECAAADAAAEADILAQDLAILGSRPETAYAFLDDADKRQDAWWSGLDGRSLPSFLRTEETVRRIAQNGRQTYQNNAVGRAAKLAKDYQAIADSMLMPELEGDATAIREKYSSIREA